MTKPRVAIVYGYELAEYHFGDTHHFGPARQYAFRDGFFGLGLEEEVEWLAPSPANIRTLESFHRRDYILEVHRKSQSGEGMLDYGDTPARRGIFEAAVHVVGSVVELSTRIMEGEFDRGFVPIAGLHHAYPDHCSGFCVFNDTAVAIEQLRREYGLKRVLYVDIDAHHGDGVFYAYESDPDVIIVDSHEYGDFFYPGTGDADETGTGPARGSKMNIPLAAGARDEDFARHWAEAETFIRDNKPEFIFFQCGADSLSGDPITHLELSIDSYRLAARSLCDLADELCEGRIVGLGGGGYNLDNIEAAWPLVVQEMLR